MDVIGVYAGHMRDDQARVRMYGIRKHLGETRFAWVGEVEPDALFFSWKASGRYPRTTPLRMNSSISSSE